MTLLIENGTVLAFDEHDTIIPNGQVSVRDGASGEREKLHEE